MLQESDDEGRANLDNDSHVAEASYALFLQSPRITYVLRMLAPPCQSVREEAHSG